MCGLAGMAGRHFRDEDATAFRELLQLAGMRGVDSTGIYLADTLGKKLLIAERKETMNSLDFVEKHGWHDYSLLHRTDFNLYLGHTRSKTIGQSNIDNCHPFNLSRYVAAHNGTLCDWEYTWGNGGKTDSEMMFQHMDELGEKGPRDVLNGLSVSSAYAVTIFDKVKRKIIFARNTKRPLWIAVNRKRPVVYWASEERFLKFVADSNQLAVDIYYFLPYTLYTIDINNFKQGDSKPWTTEDLDKPQIPEPKIKTKNKSEIWYPPKSTISPETGSGNNVILLNATTGQSQEKPVANPIDQISPETEDTIEQQLKISGITDYFNSTDHSDVRDGASLVQESQSARIEDDPELNKLLADASEIDWNDVANFT